MWLLNVECWLVTNWLYLLISSRSQAPSVPISLKQTGDDAQLTNAPGSLKQTRNVQLTNAPKPPPIPLLDDYVGHLELMSTTLAATIIQAAIQSPCIIEAAPAAPTAQTTPSIAQVEPTTNLISAVNAVSGITSKGHGPSLPTLQNDCSESPSHTVCDISNDAILETDTSTPLGCTESAGAQDDVVMQEAVPTTSTHLKTDTFTPLDCTEESAQDNVVMQKAVPTTFLETSNDEGLPPWLTQMIGYLRGVAKDTAWQDLVTQLVNFEKMQPPNGVSSFDVFISGSWCCCLLNRTCQQSTDQRRSQIGSRVKRRMLYLLWNQGCMANSSWTGGEWCNHSGGMMNRCLHTWLQQGKTGLCWEKGVQQGSISLWWAYPCGLRPNRKILTAMLGLLSMMCCGSSSRWLKASTLPSWGSKNKLLRLMMKTKGNCREKKCMYLTTLAWHTADFWHLAFVKLIKS